MSVVEVRSITPGDFISGVGVADKSFVVGAASHQILIDELYDQIFYIECGGLYNFGQREVIDDEANFEVASDLSDRPFGLQPDDPLVIEAQNYFERVHPPLPSVGDVRLVVGENHGMSLETEATDYIYNLLSELAKTNTSLFLEFLPWEIWEPVLTHYHKASAHDEISAMEDCIQGMLANIRRAKDSPGNEDLFRLIKEAKRQGVQVHGCETVASFNASNSQSHGATSHRCVVAEYTTRKILEEIDVDNFVVLFGNAHLCYEISQGGANYVKPGLGELLGAHQTIGFCVKEDAFKIMESNVLPGRVLVVHNQEEISNALFQKKQKETESFNAAVAAAVSDDLAVAADISQRVFSDLSKSLLGVDASPKRDDLM